MKVSPAQDRSEFSGVLLDEIIDNPASSDIHAIEQPLVWRSKLEPPAIRVINTVG
jgi:hypothetical protein